MGSIFLGTRIIQVWGTSWEGEEGGIKGQHEGRLAEARFQSLIPSRPPAAKAHASAQPSTSSQPQKQAGERGEGQGEGSPESIWGGGN